MWTLQLPWRVVRHLPSAARRPLDRLFGARCPACGGRAIIGRLRALSPELIETWQLPPEWVRHFEEREGIRCAACSCNRRAQQLAAVLVEEAATRFGMRTDSLAALCAHPQFHRLAVAEINSCGAVHQFLRQHPQLAYSEYGSTTVRSEDLNALTYASETFDLVLTCDTLEHVPEVWRAFAEVRRVLKPNGVHVFTVPIVAGRPTRTRAVLSDGRLQHLLPPSYHGPQGTQHEDRLVFMEAGDDFEEQVRAAGWSVRTVRDARNPAIVTFVTQKCAPASDELAPKARPHELEERPH